MRSIQVNKKKGMSIGDMYPAVLAVVIVGLVLGIGLYVLDTFHDSIGSVQTYNMTDANTSLGTTTVSNASLTNFAMKSVVIVTNGTGGETFTNYTWTKDGVITWGTDLQDYWYLTFVKYTYISDFGDTPAATTSTVLTGIATFADWIAIIVVVVAAAIVLGVVLSSFGTRRNSI